MASRLLARLTRFVPKQRTSTRSFGHGPETEGVVVDTASDMIKIKSFNRKNRNFFITMGVGFVSCYMVAMYYEDEHHHHFKRPEYKEYGHMRYRQKAFFWGDGNHSMFHHPTNNALPEGYETEDVE